MAYGDSGSGSGSGGLQNGSVTFKGFSSRANQKNFKLYDFEVAKQDLINRLSVRKGERVENPEFGTIIYDVLFEPLTEALKQAIADDITASLKRYEPRISDINVTVSLYPDSNEMNATVQYEIVGLPTPPQEVEVLLFPARL